MVFSFFTSHFSFFNPFGWYLALFAIPIVILHLWRVRLRQQSVSTLLFWEQVLAEHRGRTFGLRFRPGLSLFLSLLFLALLAGAVLNPVFSSNQAGRTVIVFDNSASMNAVDDGISRFEAAKKTLKQLLASENAQDPIALITAADKPQVVFGFAVQPEMRQKMVEMVQPTNQPKKLEQAIELARTIVRNDDNEARIFVMTDGCCESVQSLLTANEITFFPVGQPQDNIAITRFLPRRLFADPLGYEVLIELANHSDTPKECRLELTLDDQLVDLKPLTLAANSVETQILYARSAQGGILKASLDIADALFADNTAWTTLPARERQKLVLYGMPDFFLTRALQSQQNVELSIGEAIVRTDETVFVYHQTVPERIPEGNVLIVDPRNDCDLFTVGEPLESPQVGATNGDSPLMRFVSLENLPISGARKIQFPKNTAKPKILAATSEGSPFFFHWDRGNEGKITVLSADLNRGDLPLRTAFPIMVSNILDSFRSRDNEPEQTFQAADVSASDLRTAPAGFYDLREGFHSKNAPILPIWGLLTVAALLLVVFDWFLYHRRWVD